MSTARKIEEAAGRCHDPRNLLLSAGAHPPEEARLPGGALRGGSRGGGVGRSGRRRSAPQLPAEPGSGCLARPGAAPLGAGKPRRKPFGRENGAEKGRLLC